MSIPGAVAFLTLALMPIGASGAVTRVPGRDSDPHRGHPAIRVRDARRAGRQPRCGSRLRRLPRCNPESWPRPAIRETPCRTRIRGRARRCAVGPPRRFHHSRPLSAKAPNTPPTSSPSSAVTCNCGRTCRSGSSSESNGTVSVVSLGDQAALWSLRMGAILGSSTTTGVNWLFRDAAGVTAAPNAPHRAQRMDRVPPVPAGRSAAAARGADVGPGQGIDIPVRRPR